MTDIWTKLETEERPILLYGTGNGADKIIDELNTRDVKISGVFASGGFVRNREFRGFRVMSFDEAEAKFGDFVVLLSFGSSRPEVFEIVKKISERHPLFAPEVPVVGNQIFNIEFAKRHSEELFKAYSLLADRQSKFVFEQTVLYKLDGDISHLISCETSEEDAFSSILKLQKGDSFLDLGAYNGDTVLDFIERVENFGHITALEPDPKSFAKLKRNTEHLCIERINAAVSNECGRLPFSFHTSRGSSAEGSAFIDAISIDFLCKDRSFDYIKFDVEGKELDAILGGAETIKRDRPKMLVSAYHKSEDYFTIPLKVSSIRSDYQIYMRHFPSLPAWDTNFYFV